MMATIQAVSIVADYCFRLRWFLPSNVKFYRAVQPNIFYSDTIEYIWFNFSGTIDELSYDTVPNHTFIYFHLQLIIKLYLYTIELKLRDDFRCFAQKCAFVRLALCR